MDDKDKQDIKGFNTRCEELRSQLYNLINTSNLPIAPIFYIVRNLYHDCESSYYSTLNNESMNTPQTITKTISLEDEDN